MKTTPLNHVKVCKCGHELTVSTDVIEEKRPEKDDITICIRCCHLYAFNEDLSLREITIDEVNEKDRPRVNKYIKAIAAAKLEIN